MATVQLKAVINGKSYTLGLQAQALVLVKDEAPAKGEPLSYQLRVRPGGLGLGCTCPAYEHVHSCKHENAIYRLAEVLATALSSSSSPILESRNPQ